MNMDPVGREWRRSPFRPFLKTIEHKEIYYDYCHCNTNPGQGR
jgi:hypothetical protein